MAGKSLKNSNNQQEQTNKSSRRHLLLRATTVQFLLIAAPSQGLASPLPFSDQDTDLYKRQSTCFSAIEINGAEIAPPPYKG